MNARACWILLCAGGWAGPAPGQPATAIRFDNGLSEITVAPGNQVRVTVWATGLPPLGTPIAWTTPPGTGQVGFYEGFRGVLMNMQASSGSWSAMMVAPGMGFWHGGYGWPSGSHVNGISIGVGFNPPVPGNEFPLWHGRITVGNQDVTLRTVIQPVGAPPQTGFEAHLGGILPNGVSHFLTTIDGTAVIHVPGPAGAAVLGVAGLFAARRRRPVGQEKQR